MTTLIIGADTTLGHSLSNFLDLRGNEYVALPRSDCRWKSERQVKKALRRDSYSFVIDLRLQSAVDGGSRLHDIDVNRCGWLASVCHKLKIPLFTVSSARAFSGVEGHAYLEDDYLDGQPELAKMLAGAEELVRDQCMQHVILRLGTVFSEVGSNPLTRLLAMLHENGHLALDRHHRGCPVPADDAARVISGMLDQFSCGLEQWGIYHYCSSDITSCYGFGEVLLAAASQYAFFTELEAESLLVAREGDVQEYKLSCERIRDTFAIKQQPWRASVAACVKQFYSTYTIKEKQDGDRHQERDATA